MIPFLRLTLLATRYNFIIIDICSTALSQKGKVNLEKIFAFIDSQNLNLGVKNDIVDLKTREQIYTGWRLSFPKLYRYLVDKYKVTKAYIFIGKVEGNEGLYSSLADAGYELIFKPTLEITYPEGGTTRKGNVDAELVLQTMIELENFDKAIIIAGDGDYYCLIKHLISIGKLSKILIPNRYRFSRLLNEFRDYFEYVSDLEAKLKK